MAVVCNTGFVATAKRLIGTGAAAFTYIELGTDSYTENATVSQLSAAITDSGLSRVSATTVTTTQSATADDTAKFEHTWTATGSKNVKETGVFNTDTGGDILCYATFASAIPMESDDTLKVTWLVQIKSA